MLLSAVGYIQVHAFFSYAQIPLKDVAVTITDKDGSAIAMRLTNRNGTFDTPVEIATPNLSTSLTPNTGSIPFTVINLYARLENYEEISIENLQIFANRISNQNLEMIPLAEYPDTWNKSESFQIPSQNL